MPPHSTPQFSSFEETPTPTDLKATMAACRLNLNALLTYMVGKHGLQPETATRYIGRSTVRVIRDFRQESQMSHFLSDPDFETQPIPLIKIIGPQDDSDEVKLQNEADQEIKIRFAEDQKMEPKGHEASEKDAFDDESFFSDPDIDKTPIRDTRILQLIEEELASGVKEEGDESGENEGLDDDDKTTPLAPQQKARKSSGPLILPRLKLRKDPALSGGRETVCVTPTPSMALEADSLANAVLHFAEAEAKYRITSDGRAEVTEKLELDFSDL